MTGQIATRAFAVWLVILVLAVVNGTVREAVIIPRLGTVSGLILSGLLLSLFIVGATYCFLPWLTVRSPAQLHLIGLCWLAFTLVFEFSFGLLRGKALAEILEAYTFKDGNIWPVVLVVTATAPWLAARLKGWS